MTPSAEYDASGLNCPLPMIRAAKKLKALETGDVLKVVSTDVGANIPPNTCRNLGPLDRRVR